MSALDQAMISHMRHIVNEDYRPFSYQDFLIFEVDGKRYSMAHGTFRNKISKLIKQGIAELSYNSHLSFYTLRGKPFGKLMTRDHMGVSSDPLCRYIQNLPLGKESIHDIRLRFKVPNIWKILSRDSYTIDTINKDIRLPAWPIGELVLKATIHRTNTVSIVISCSYTPIPVNIDGIIQFTNALAIARDRILGCIEDCLEPQDETYDAHFIPEYVSWLVTMWHFGADALVEYTGPRFCITWYKIEHVYRLYAKKMLDGRTRVRLERQEYPKKTLLEAIQEKLGLTSTALT